MTSSPARSMSRMAVSAASSNISSRSAGPNWPASCAFTEAYHQPPLPWEPTTVEGIRGSSAIGHVLSSCMIGAVSDDTHARILAIVGTVNGDAELVRRGRHCSTTFLLEAGDTSYLVRVLEGR